jgi:septal ring factor EnvC (AmiA/AmiB activator)
VAGDLDIVGGAAVDVVPIVPNFHTKLKAIVLPIADRVGEEAGQKMGEAISKHIVIAIPDGITDGGKIGVRLAGKQGDDAGGAFARSIRRKLEAAFKAMPKLDVKLGDTGVDAELARIRAKLEQLSNKRVGIDVSAEDAEAEITRLEAKLQELGAQHPNVAVRADTAAARAALAEIRAEIAAVGGRRTVTLEVDGAFGAKLRAVVAEAQASIPDINVDADTSPARAEVQELRARLAALADVRVGIDIDAGTALAEIQAIQERLELLSIQRHDIDVRVDAARAAAQLAALDAEVDSVKILNIKALADTSGASSALMGLGVQMAILTAIPLGPVLAAGIGAIASAAVAAGAGVGVLALAAVPAIKGVTEAITAKSAADKEASSASDNSVAAGNRAAQSALQTVGAQQALTSAHRNAARSIAQASEQIENAERSVAQASQRAAEQRRQAVDSVVQAERSLADAQRQEQQAQTDLTQARKDAAQQLADLNDKLTDGKLSERDATLRVTEAEEQLNQTRLAFDAGKASDTDLARAQLSYDQAVQAQKEQSKNYTQLQADAKAAEKAGVNGNANVKTAAQQLADAQQNVKDQVTALAKAQRDAAQAEIDAAQSVADAQRNLADAVQNAANTQVDAADSIASAERGVESARLSSSNATGTATTKADEYKRALAKLTPAQRDLYDSIAGPKGLTKALKDWSKELQPDVLLLFTRGVDGAKNSLPGLTPLVKTTADAVGILFDKASKALRSPFWTGFKDDINKNAKPAIVGLGISFGNIITGMAGIVDAFLPHMDGISKTMQRITKRFADWGKNLKGSPSFEKFLQYVKDNSPGLAEFLGDLLSTIVDVAQALAPLSQTAMDVVKPMLDGISWLANHAPWTIQLLWGLYTVFKAITLMQAGFAAAMLIYDIAVAGATLVTSGWAAAIQATGIVPLIEAIVLVIALLVIGIIWAYKNVGWFRTIVDTSWHFIRDVTVWLWEKALKPVFQGMWTLIKLVGDISVWLWQKALSPAFDAIGLAARILFAVVVVAVLTPMWLAFQALGLISMWLWEKAIKPSLGFIGALAVWVWKNQLQPFFQSMWNAIQWVGAKFKWLYDHAIKPISEWIGSKVKALWDSWLSPAFSSIWDGIQWLGGKFKWLYDKGVKPIVDDIASAFKSMGKSIKAAWDDVVDHSKTPVNFIIKWVYTNGIKAVWDKVASFVGLSKLPAAPKLLEAGGTVGSGWGTARPMVTNRPTAIVGEGNPRYPEYVIPTDPKYRGQAQALHRQAGTQLLESGGVLGGIWDWTKDTVSDVVGKGVDWAKTGASLLSDPSSVWKKLTTPILNKVSDGVGTSPMGKALTQYPTKMVAGLKDKIVTAAESLFSSGGGGGGQWIKPVNVPFGTRFGVSGPMWSSGHHTGLDFPAPTGTPVHAVADGDVTGAASGGPYGNHVILSHGGGLASLYAHMSKILTAVGKHVTQGQEIGKVGATGNVTGPHLHLEARVNGAAVDPMPYLTGSKGFTAGAAGTAQKYAKGMLGQHGWDAGQFGPLKSLWQGESGWNYRAKNPSSGAYGIPQALPASKMASAGSDWLTNYATQIRWGLGYIDDRYGTPANAYSKWMARSPHWYDDGGMLPTGLSLVANGTGSPEPVFTGSQWSDIRAAKSGGGTSTIHADVKVFIGDREITDIVDTRIELHEDSTASAITTGRWV